MVIIIMIKLLLLSLFFCAIGYGQETTTTTSVYFDTDEFVLTTDAIQVIDGITVTDSLQTIKNIFLTGYCDDRGSISYNKQLASKRIWSIIDYLKPKYGYNSFNEAPVGELPLTSSQNIKKQRQNNRRVDIEITYELIQPEVVVAPKVQDTITGNPSYDIFKDSLQIGDKLVFNNIIFYPGRHKMRPVSYPVMDSIINSLLIHKKYEVEIQGHICCLKPGVNGRDMDTGKWNLSLARANAVKELLKNYGVDSTRLKAVGKRSDFKTGKGDYYDRRVELLITGIREDD